MAATDLRAASERLLRALDNLDWPVFEASWAATPTAFLPFDDTPATVEGQAVLERFRVFFTEVRSHASGGAPYLGLKPKDLRVQDFGDAGLVTFVMDQPAILGGPPIARRTLLFVRDGGAWKLAHLHASAAGKR
jgi:hypothetical protein